MIEEKDPIPLVCYVCSRANLSNAVQITAINTFITKQAHLKAIARFEDEQQEKRQQLYVALKRMREDNCQGMITYDVALLTNKLSSRDATEILAHFIGPQAKALYDVNGLVSQSTLLSLRNSFIAQMHQDVD